MPNQSQGPSGSGLATSLVNDFRAIMSSLESQRSGVPATDAVEPPAADTPASEPPAAEAAPAAEVPAGQDRNTTLPTRFARPPGSPKQRELLPDRPAPMPYAEVRGMITALGDVRDMLSNRRLPAALSETEASAALAAAAPADIAAESPSQSRRRAFGTTTKAEEAAARRRRSASKDVITWQRLGLLAVFVGIAGGGAMALQSLVGREEAKVAPEVIGNAAIASVAPSAPMPFIATPTPPQAAPPVQVASAPVRPTLRNAEPEIEEIDPEPMDAVMAATASAFAASEAIASPIPAPKPLPKLAPLPTPAPKHAAVAAAPAAAAAAEKEEADPDEADGSSAFGGDPTGNATIRSSVTMRAAPKNGAAAVLNLQGGQKVELVACKGWCEIIAEGKRGFIYKRFVEAGAPKQAEAATQ